MSIIEQAAKRLEELTRAGVNVPWDAAGMADTELHLRVRAAVEPRSATLRSPPASVAPVVASGAAPVIRRIDPVRPVNAPGPVPKPPTVNQTAARHQRHSTQVDIDLRRLENTGFLVPSTARSELAEQFRHVKRPLLKNVFNAANPPESRASLIMVTSSIPGEGKTFTSINLAMSIAMEIDTSVLLVDGDVVRPSVPDRLGFRAGRGLLDLLQDPDLDPSEVLLRTNVPKLAILPAGAPNTRSTELLASTAMERLLADLAERYSDRVVIFDAPPLLLTSEARVLAARFGQVVLVVNAGSTPRTVVTKALAALENIPIVLPLLNRCEDIGQFNGHHYYYG